MIKVCYCAPFTDASGYGEASRNAIQALVVAGADICTQKVKFTKHTFPGDFLTKSAEELSERQVDYQIKIIHTTPDVYKNYIEKGKYNIGHLFWETDKLPASWVASCNQLDEIWTGTELNRKSIQDSGVKVPVKVYPQSINLAVPDVRPFKLPNFDGFLFYSIFEWRERKNPKALLDAFWKEFKGQKDVALLIKTHKGDFQKDAVEAIIHEARTWKNELGFKDTPKVFICTNVLSTEEKHRLHKTGNCFVSAHRGEGWGLPQVEAVLHKNPVISTKYGGVHEYWDGKHYKPVKFELVPIKQIHNKYYEPGMKWAEVDADDLRRRMRDMYELSINKKKKGLVKISAAMGKNYANAVFDYKSVGDRMLKRLGEIQATL